APQSTGTPGGPMPGLPQPPQKRAEESPWGTTQQPLRRRLRELQRRAHRPRQQPSTPDITPQAEARQSPGGPGPGKQTPGVSRHTPKHPAPETENQQYTSGQRHQPPAGSVAGRK
ncbi:hypothetical protein ATANTOWER_023645, partial [Ataeniobius toweri]|nr:hypothetical protein [Ataeniobius toweri]